MSLPTCHEKSPVSEQWADINDTKAYTFFQLNTFIRPTFKSEAGHGSWNGKNQQLVPSHMNTWSRNRLYRRWDECSDSEDRTNIYWLLWRRRSEHKMPSNQKKRHLRQYLPLNNVGGKSAPIWHKTQKNVHVAIATGWLMSMSVAVTTNTNFLSVMCSQHMSDIL